MRPLQTDRFIGQLALKRTDHALGSHLVFFSQQNILFDERIDDLQRQITAGVAIAITNPLSNGHILVGSAANVAADVAMSGEATIINTGAVTLSNAAVIGKVLTGFVAVAAPIVATDTILQAFGKTQGQIAAIAAGTVTSVSGTLNRITSTGGATPVIDIAATYVGQTSLTTLGTITTGTWNATRISEVYGGTNQNSYATGDLLYASGVNILSKLTATTNGFVLTLAGGVPTWAAAGGGGTPAGANTEIQFNNAGAFGAAAGFTYTAAKVTITGNNTGTLGALYIPAGDVVNQYIVLHEAAASPNSAYLTFKSSGGNAIAMGALFSAGAPVSYVFTDPSGVPLNTIDATTGVNTLLNLAGVGTRMVTASAAGVLGAAAIPANTTIVNDPNWAALGDLVYGTGAATGAILPGHTNADNRYLKQTGTGAVSAAPQWVRIDAGDITAGTLPSGIFPALTGDVTTTIGTVATTISANAVSNTKLADMAVSTVKGRVTAGTGDPEDLTPAQVESILGITRKVKATLQTDAIGTFVDITDLNFSVAASTTYTFTAYGRMGSTAANGGTFTVTCPAGATIEFQIIGMTSAVTNQTGVAVTVSGSSTVNLATAISTGFPWWITGSVVVGATAGTVNIQMRTLNVANTFTVYAGSVIEAKKVN